MKYARVTKTKDTNYKKGLITCKCGWTDYLGDGFNQHWIKNCPKCTALPKTYNKAKVITGTPGNYIAEIGEHTYFVLSNGIHAQYSKNVYFTRAGLTLAQADRM